MKKYLPLIIIAAIAVIGLAAWFIYQQQVVTDYYVAEVKLLSEGKVSIEKIDVDYKDESVAYREQTARIARIKMRAESELENTTEKYRRMALLNTITEKAYLISITHKRSFDVSEAIDILKYDGREKAENYAEKNDIKLNIRVIESSSF